MELADLMFKNKQYRGASEYYLEIKVYKRVMECYELEISTAEANKEHEVREAYAEVLEGIQLYEKAKEQILLAISDL